MKSVENKVIVIAFMREHKSINAEDVLFYSPEAFLFQEISVNNGDPVGKGIVFESNEIIKLQRSLDVDALHDVITIWEQYASINSQPYKPDFEGHQFCQKYIEDNFMLVLTDNNALPENIADVWIRHFLTSMCLTPPNYWNFDGQFGILPNLAWFPERRMCLAKDANQFINDGIIQTTPYAVDKFPRLTDWWIPSGVRIADVNRVRLGAHLSSGTTVMHEGFCNFNAGTLGASMVEGRISAGVVVGKDSDIGGGASIMGTLSGGGKEKISIGEKCLLGANSGLGISLGNNCIVEAGLYLTAGTKVRLSNEEVVAARDISGCNNRTFIRNSQTGEVLALDNKKGGIVLNQELHKN